MQRTRERIQTLWYISSSLSKTYYPVTWARHSISTQKTTHQIERNAANMIRHGTFTD